MLYFSQRKGLMGLIDLSVLFDQNFIPADWMLTRKQKQIVTYIRDHPGEVCYLPLKELSQKAGCTEVTLLRLFQRLGFGGYSDFRREYRQSYEVFRSPENTALTQDFQRSQQQNLQLLGHICQQERQHLYTFMDAMDLRPIMKAAQAIHSADYTLLMGRGISHTMTEVLSYRLGVLGVRAVVVNPEESTSLEGHMNTIDEHTTLVALTFPRYLNELGAVTQLAAAKGAKVVAITDSPASPIVPFSHTAIYCPMARGTLYNSFVPVLTVINLIAHSIAIQRGGGNQSQKLERLRLTLEGTHPSALEGLL